MVIWVPNCQKSKLPKYQKQEFLVFIVLKMRLRLNINDFEVPTRIVHRLPNVLDHSKQLKLNVT